MRPVRARRAALARSLAVACAFGISSLPLSRAEASPAGESASPPETGEALVPLPARVDEVVVIGLTRTAPGVPRREIGFAAGDTITEHDLDLAVARLWNTTIFARVKVRVVRGGEGGDRVRAVFVLEDRWTLNPLIGYGAGGNAFFFRVGAADNNILGRFLEVQAQYQWFDGFHGGQVILRDPRTFGQRLETTVQAERLVRPRPGFSDQRTLVRLEVFSLRNEDFFRFGARIDGFWDRFLPPLDPPTRLPAPTGTLLVEPAMRIGRVDTERLLLKGASLEVRHGIGATTSPVASTYAQTTIEALVFAAIGARWNLAARARLATITRVPEHLELYVGGLDLVRGYADNRVRTRGYALANLEMRFVAFDSTWIALMPVAFTDAVLSESPKGPAGEDVPRALLSAGAGLRILVPKFVGTGFRFDLAVPAERPRVGLNVGVYQFF